LRERALCGVLRERGLQRRQRLHRGHVLGERNVQSRVVRVRHRLLRNDVVQSVLHGYGLQFAVGQSRLRHRRALQHVRGGLCRLRRQYDERMRGESRDEHHQLRHLRAHL
jgi:hypothetical protein